MKGLYDIHCHILPGVDDGARNMEEALWMLNKEYKERGQLLCAYQLSFDFTEEGGILSYLSGKTIRLPKVAFVHKYFSGVHY